MEGKVSNPAEWPEPFTVAHALHPELVEVSPGHSVRASGALRSM